MSLAVSLTLALAALHAALDNRGRRFVGDAYAALVDTFRADILRRPIALAPSRRPV